MPQALAATINNTQDVITLLDVAANWFFAIVLAISVLGVLYGAASFLGAGGDTEKFTQARWIVIGSLIGAAIATVSKALVGVVSNFFR